jgi:hypothetical protein
MMAEQEVKTGTVEEIFADADQQTQKTLYEIFGYLHPQLTYPETKLAEVFTQESAGDFLARITDLESLLSESDTFEQTLEKFQGQIDTVEQVRDEVMAKLFEQLRPIEVSYRQIWLFFENSVIPDGKQRMPVEFFVYNAEATAMKNRESVTLESIRRFIQSRNDNFNFRDDICNLVVPGPIPMMIREALEEEAWKWGMLLVTDLADEKSYNDVERQFRPGGRYEFLKRPDNKAASDVVMVGFLKLRDGHWFEQSDDDENDLYAPASVIFAGALARTDRARDSVVQGPVGTKFGQIKGVENARIECLISQMELLSQEMQVIPIIRDADNHLCFYGCRSLADDPYGIYRFFTSYRVLMYLERCICNILQSAVVSETLTRTMLEYEIKEPIVRFLMDQKIQGTIANYDLYIDKTLSKIREGIYDISLTVTPTPFVEVIEVKVYVPADSISHEMKTCEKYI